VNILKELAGLCNTMKHILLNYRQKLNKEYVVELTS